MAPWGRSYDHHILVAIMHCDAMDLHPYERWARKTVARDGLVAIHKLQNTNFHELSDETNHLGHCAIRDLSEQ